MLISVLYLTVSRTLSRTVSPRELNHGENTDLKLYYSAVQIVNRYSVRRIASLKRNPTDNYYYYYYYCYCY